MNAALTANRIVKQLEERRAQNRGALLPYFTSGFPNAELTREFIVRADQPGVPVVEIGEPYSDSIADGPVIQESFHDALQNGHRLKDTFELVSSIRSSVSCGLVSMVSYTIVQRYGCDAYFREAAACGFDGVILPDVPVEESASLYERAEAAGLCYIGLIAPTTSHERRAQIAKSSTGFLYQVAAAGTTGERSRLAAELPDEVGALRGLSTLPVCVGFGVSTPEHVREVCAIADGAIVGSAIVRRIREALREDTSNSHVAAAVEHFIRELVEAADTIRTTG